MKKYILVLATMSLLISCNKSDKDILEKVASNITNIKTITYQSVLEVTDNGQIIHQDTTQMFFDFTKTNPIGLNYHFLNDDGELTYDGEEVFQVIHSEKVITTNDDNNPDVVKNPLINTLSYFRQVLPKLIQDEHVDTTRNNDTIINGNNHFSFNFVLHKRYIDFFSYEFKEGIDYDSEYSLLVNETNYLPYKIVFPNGKDGSITRTIDNIILDQEVSDDFWLGKKRPKDYLILTEQEYFKNRENNVLANVGKQIIDLELPNLENDELINLSNLKGSIILLEFWFKGCGGCVAAIPSLNDINNKFQNRNFKIYGIEIEERYKKSELIKYKNKENIQFSILYKGKNMASNYGIRSAPIFMIIDKSGVIIDIKSGYSKENIDNIISVIEKNL